MIRPELLSLHRILTAYVRIDALMAAKGIVEDEEASWSLHDFDQQDGYATLGQKSEASRGLSTLTCRVEARTDWNAEEGADMYQPRVTVRLSTKESSLPAMIGTLSLDMDGGCWDVESPNDKVARDSHPLVQRLGEHQTFADLDAGIAFAARIVDSYLTDDAIPS